MTTLSTARVFSVRGGLRGVRRPCTSVYLHSGLCFYFFFLHLGREFQIGRLPSFNRQVAVSD